MLYTGKWRSQLCYHTIRGMSRYSLLLARGELVQAQGNAAQALMPQLSEARKLRLTLTSASCSWALLRACTQWMSRQICMAGSWYSLSHTSHCDLMNSAEPARSCPSVGHLQTSLLGDAVCTPLSAWHCTLVAAQLVDRLVKPCQPGELVAFAFQRSQGRQVLCQWVAGLELGVLLHHLRFTGLMVCGYLLAWHSLP